MHCVMLCSLGVDRIVSNEAPTTSPIDADKLFTQLCDYARLPAEEGPDSNAASSPESLVDEASLYQHAKYHRVLPLVHLNRLRRGEQVESWVHDDLRVSLTRNQFFLDELRSVLNTLDKRAVSVIPFKGPVLTHRLFPDLRYRFSGDLDVLIPPEALDTVITTLQSAGYETVDNQSWLGRQIRTLIHSQHTLARGGAFFFLDVHTRIMPRLYAYRQAFDALWDRAEPVEISGQTIRCLGPVDQLLMLCYQGVKNRWDRLKYVVDVAAALQAFPRDGQALMGTARSLSSERSLLLGCLLAQDLLGAPVPAPVAARLAEAPVVHELAARVTRGLARPQSQGIDAFWDRAAFQLRVQDSLGPRMRYIGYALVRRVVDTSATGN